MKADHLVTKICAVWLLLLTAVPFTAPFPTCDLAAWLSPPGTGSPLPPAADTSSQAFAPTDSILSRWLPASCDSGRVRPLLVAGARDAPLVEDMAATPMGSPRAGATSASSSAQRSILRI